MENIIRRAAFDLDSKLGDMSGDIEKLKALLHAMNSDFFAPEAVSVNDDGSDAFLDTAVMVRSYPHFRTIASMCGELADQIEGIVDSSRGEINTILDSARGEPQEENDTTSKEDVIRGALQWWSERADLEHLRTIMAFVKGYLKI